VKDAYVYGSVTIDYYFSNKLFTLVLEVAVKKSRDALIFKLPDSNKLIFILFKPA